MQSYYRLKNLGSKKVHTLKQPHVILGRNSFSDIHIDSGLLSRQHAEFRQEGDRIVVEDLGSTNGTYVNNMRIDRPIELMHGDVVTAGRDKFMLIAPDKNDGSTVFTYNMSQEPEPVLETEGAANHTQMQKAAPNPLGWSSIQVDEEEKRAVNQHILQRALGQREYDAHKTPAVLVVRNGANQGKVYDLNIGASGKAEWEVGRNKFVDIVIDHPTVSNQHAKIRCENDQWVIADSQSTNGLKVNYRRVTQAACQSGDIISLGSLELVLKVL